MYINLKGHLMRVCFYTLGCKVNLNETGALEQMFRSAGFTIVPEGEEADVFVVNSCTVTNFGDQVRGTAGGAVRDPHPRLY